MRRPDFKLAVDLLDRVDALAKQFREYNFETWPHLKNREDFGRIYALEDEEIVSPLDELYCSGRDFAVHFSHVLESYLHVEDHPNFTSFVEHVEDRITKTIPEQKIVLENARRAAAATENVPWAIGQMIQLHDNQLRVADSLRGWVRMAKNNQLYRMENGMNEQSDHNRGGINIQHFQGILGDVIHSTVEQNLRMEIPKGDFASVRRTLRELKIEEADIAELEQAVKTDLPPASQNSFGPNVASWIGKMVGKAATGAYQLTVGTAGSVLAEIICKYYGLK